MTAEVATAEDTESDNPIANVDIYWKVSGLALAVVALLGITVNAIGGNYAYVPNVEFMESVLVFDWAHNILHVALAALALTFGFGDFDLDLSKNIAATIGVVYIALGVLGFIPFVADLLRSLLTLQVEAGENVIHLALGTWGAYAGFT